MGNIDSARRLIESLRAAGVDEFCVCAGSRNSPLLAVLGATSTSLYSFVDERAAAFFAVGRSKLHGAPVAVVTTSGTAVAEMLPAAIEAYYGGLPLVLVSADRPERFRGTGAPQSIEQEGIFGVYAETDLDSWTRTRPLHLNIAFDEPLIDEEPVRGAGTLAVRATCRASRASASLSPEAAAVVHESKRPLVILGGLRAGERQRAKAFALRLNAPVYAEPLSGLREDPELPIVTSGERILREGRFDAVIRIGNVPTLRFWRDLEQSEVPAAHFSTLPFTGLTRGVLSPVEALPGEVEPRERDEEFFQRDREAAGVLVRIVEDEPQSELALVRELSKRIPPNSRVYLGNSLPVREWDLVATRDPRGFEVEANRGANGIDGQLSTFFGQCEEGRDNVCVVGDLTTIYDLAAPWIVPQLGPVRFRIVIVNNGGGRIFGRVPSLRAMAVGVRERLVENVHRVRFAAWADMWSLGGTVTELLPDIDASARVWRRIEELQR